MSLFDHTKMDNYLMARIVKKFNSVKTGARFYRCSRAAKDLAEWCKPAWSLTDTKLKYGGRGPISGKKRVFCQDEDGNSFSRKWPTLPLEFCRIEQLVVMYCSADFFGTVVMPDMEAIGAVGTLQVTSGSSLSEEQVQLLVAATKPETLKVWRPIYDRFSAVFKDVKNLYITPFRREDLTYGEIFDLMVNRKTISYEYDDFSLEQIVALIKTWLEGTSTDSLEKLTLVRDTELQDDILDEVMGDAEIQNLARSCVRGADDWILEREGGGQVRISDDDNGYCTRKLHFQFL